MADDDDWTDFNLQPMAEDAESAPEPAPELRAEPRAEPRADPWAEFKPQAVSEPRAVDPWAEFKPQEPARAAPEAEGMLGTAAREFAHGIVPAVVGGVGAIGGGIVGGIPGALAGGIGAGTAASYLQERALKELGFDDSQQRAVNAAVNPWSAAGGGAATAVVPFGIAGTGTRLATRAATAGVMGGIEAGKEAVTGVELSPEKIITSAAAGAVFAEPRGFTTRGGTALAGRLGFEPRPGFPSEQAQPLSDDQTRKANPSAVQSRGVARESAPPDTGEPPVTGERMREAPQGSAKGPEDYGKEPTIPAVTNVTESDPALDAALAAKFPAVPTPVEPAALARAAEAPEGTVPPGLQAMARRAITRARPTQTEPLPIGTEPAILEAGAQRAAEPLAAQAREQAAAPAEALRRPGGAEAAPPPPPPEPPAAPPAGPQPPGGEPPGAPPQPPAGLPPRRGVLADLQNIFAPQTRGPMARQVANWIRGAYGRATQVNEQANAMLQPHMPTVDAMSEADQRAMVNRIQGGNAFPDWRPTPAQQTLMGDVKRVTDMWASEIGKLDRAQGIDWVENYLPGMYKNGDQNQQFFRDWSQRAGGAGSLKAKTFPTYEEARAAGLEPYTNNPIEMLQLYGQKMRNFVGRQTVMERGLNEGTFIRPAMRPEVVGAAGAPEPQIKRPLPPGYVESKTAPGVYMPEEVVKAWDNFYDAGLKGRYPNAYEAIRGLNAAWTNLELSLNGYHAFTMANEGIISDVAMGIEKLAGGDIAGGLRTIATAPAAPIQRARLGTHVQKGYLDPNSSDPITKALVEQGGFRPIGRSHAQDSLVGQKTFLTSLKDLPQQLTKAVSDVRQDLLDSKGNLLELAKFPFRTAQRVIATISHPLFDVYIPKLKAGAAYAQMQHWREMNPSRIGTAAETEAARKIVDSIDNRFGEMVTDHLFMNKAVQDSAVAGMRSFSWLVGSMKEIGGGAYAGLRAPVRAAIERDPSYLGVLNPRSEHYDPRVAYAIAMPMVIGMTSAVYQYLLGSHEAPTSWRDLYAPRTGGTYKGAAEHMLMPGYHKDVYGWLAHPGIEAYNKLGGLWQTAIEEFRGRETPALGGLPFIRPNATFLQNVTDRMSYLFSKLGPIGVRAVAKGQEKGSAIPAPLTAAGFHPTGAEISKPEKVHAVQEKQYAREYKQRQKRIQREQAARQ